MIYSDINLMFADIKKYPKLTIICDSSRSDQFPYQFHFTSLIKDWAINVEDIPSDKEYKILFEIFDYIKLSYEEKIIKSIIE